MKDLFIGNPVTFDGFELERFPQESCTVKDPQEQGVFDSPDIYLCAIVDRRFPSQLRMEYLHPYTFQDEEILFAWVSLDNKYRVDHCIMPVNDAPFHRVVAWKKVETVTNFIQI